LRQQWEQHIEVVWLFPSEAGTPLIPSNFSRHWRGERPNNAAGNGTGNGKQHIGIRQHAGLAPTVTFHHLRHTCATRLMELGVAEEIRAAILGHGKRGITQHYAHATVAAMRRALEAYEQLLLG
jgi:integrase